MFGSRAPFRLHTCSTHNYTGTVPCTICNTMTPLSVERLRQENERLRAILRAVPVADRIVDAILAGRADGWVDEHDVQHTVVTGRAAEGGE